MTLFRCRRFHFPLGFVLKKNPFSVPHLCLTLVLSGLKCGTWSCFLVSSHSKKKYYKTFTFRNMTASKYTRRILHCIVDKLCLVARWLAVAALISGEWGGAEDQDTRQCHAIFFNITNNFESLHLCLVLSCLCHDV